MSVSVVPSLGTLWLAPRLGNFQEQFPEIALRYLAAEGTPDLIAGEVDVRVTYGAGDYPGFVTTPLMDDQLFPVCAPALVNRQPIRNFADLRHHILLQDIGIDAAEPMMTWRRWLREAGQADLQSAGWVEFNNSILLTLSALAGQGVALGRRSLVAEHLAAGRLVRPLRATRSSDYSYYVVTTEVGRTRPRVRAFIAWLERQVAQITGDGPSLAYDRIER